MAQSQSIYGRWLMGLLMAASACEARPPETSVSAWFEPAVSAVFTGHAGPGLASAFDAIAADMDLDGDPDLLINWHHLAPLELFENRGGAFALVNAPGADTSGLYDNRGVPNLYAAAPEMQERIAASGAPGLYLWHEPLRIGSWRLAWRGAGPTPLRARLETSRRIEDPIGLETGEFERTGPGRIEVAIDRARADFQVRTRPVGTRLEIHVDSAGAEPPPVLYLGAESTRWPSDTAVLWKADPHGVAWVHSEGSPRPEIFIARGAQIGALRPPQPPKRDRYYLGGTDPLYRFAPIDTVLPDYKRGRRVEWTDLDNDGVLELSISNKGAPIGLLVRQPGGELRDRAAELGLAFVRSDVTAWFDVDDDGYQDLVYLDGSSIWIAINHQGRSFERRPGREIGLALPEIPKDARLFDSTALRLADFDDDGRLDLWVLGHGPDRTLHLFVRDGDRFVDVSSASGLSARAGNDLTVLIDVDDDGYEDAVSFGEAPVLWKNERGERFRTFELGDEFVPERITAAVALDADGDGATDLVLVGARRHLLRGRASNRHVDVVLRSERGEPIGALVRARYADGSAVVRRYGSADNTVFSQALLPLRFGIDAERELIGIDVRWPGAVTPKRYEPVQTGGPMLVEP